MYFIFIALLIAMSAFFSATETAFSSVNRIRLKNYAANGNKRAKKALEIAENFDKALTAILIGNNVVNIASASLGTIAFTEMLGPSGVGISTAVMTVVVLIFGEILPKSLAKENAEKFALAVTHFLNFLMIILTPFVFFFSLLKNGVVKLVGAKNDAPTVTEDELKYIINEIEDQGVLEEQESDLVRSALEFDEITVERILIPRVNICAVNKDESIEKIRDIFLSEKFSRLPVYDRTVDNIVGIIHEKDFYSLLIKGGTSLDGIITEVPFIPQTKRISEVLHEMQRKKVHLAVVLDEYGGTLGIVTMEDIIEELVGEIYDENDEIIQDVIKVNENCYEVSAELSIADLLERLSLPENLIESESTSLGGWVMELLERIPQAGDHVQSGIFDITVKETDEQRVLKLLIKVDMPEKSS